MKKGFVTVSTTEGAMDIYVAYPDKSGHHPAIVVLQEAFGVNHHIKDVCHRFAQEGYVAAAPELFHRAGKNLEIGYSDFEKVKPVLANITNQRLVDDVNSTLTYLEHDAMVDAQKIAVVGYCMGGFAAMLSACHLSLTTAISYYGGGMVHERPGFGFRPFLHEFKNISCPVLLVYGEKDSGIPAADIEAIQAELSRNKKVFEILIYEGAGHGFACDERASYHPAAAKKSWNDTLKWLSEKMS